MVSSVVAFLSFALQPCLVAELYWANGIGQSQGSRPWSGRAPGLPIHNCHHADISLTPFLLSRQVILEVVDKKVRRGSPIYEKDHVSSFANWSLTGALFADPLC